MVEITYQEWCRRVAVVMINHVMPYLKKNNLKLSDTKLTPKLLSEYVQVINWGSD